MNEIIDPYHINAVDLTVALAAIKVGERITSGELEADDPSDQQKLLEQVARLRPRLIDYTEVYEMMRLVAGDHDMVIRFAKDGDSEFTVTRGSLISANTTNHESSSLDFEDTWENSDG